MHTEKLKEVRVTREQFWQKKAIQGQGEVKWLQFQLASGGKAEKPGLKPRIKLFCMK